MYFRLLSTNANRNISNKKKQGNEKKDLRKSQSQIKSFFFIFRVEIAIIFQMYKLQFVIANFGGHL